MLNEKIKNDLKFLYNERKDLDKIINDLGQVIKRWQGDHPKSRWLSEKDAMLITYADTLYDDTEKPLRVLRTFLENKVKDAIPAVHLLPIYPYTSDDGFSVVDYTAIDDNLGSWEDVERMAEKHELMFDAVLNHISASSEWFRKFLKWDEKYKDYFIVCDPLKDYSQVLRPRALPLLTRFDTADGDKYVWTTFSEDQIDLNYKNPEVLLDMVDVLCQYASHGARYIRVDSATYMWKEDGTACAHLPKTHALLRVMRSAVEMAFPDTIIISEASVPFKDNITYLGNGDEAHMIYQFTLSPLVLYTFLVGNTEKLTGWAKTLKDVPLSPKSTYFNMISCHDGIGLLSIEGILSEEEKKFLCDECQRRGGYISYRNTPEHVQKPYEINITYVDALTPASADDRERAERVIAAHGIMMSFKGIPAIYIEALLGSRNWTEGVEISGIKRRINREKLSREKVEKEIETPGSLRQLVFDGITGLLKVRQKEKAFHPDAEQMVLSLDQRVFALRRINQVTGDSLVAVINVTDQKFEILSEVEGVDILSGESVKEVIEMDAYQVRWIKE